jgi:hypothetical protein
LQRLAVKQILGLDKLSSQCLQKSTLSTKLMYEIGEAAALSGGNNRNAVMKKAVFNPTFIGRKELATLQLG